MAATTWSPDLRRPGYATRVMCDVANERGISTSDLLAGTGIAPVDLENPEALVAACDEIVAVRRLLRLVPDTAGLGDRGGYQVPADSPRALRVRGDVLRDPAGALRCLDALLLADDAQHRCQAVRGRRPGLLELDVDHLPEDVQEFFLERDVARIVTTVSDFALPVLAAYADQVVAEVMLDDGVLGPLVESCRSPTSSSVVRTTACTSRARSSTSRCRRPISTPCRCASPNVTS